MDRFSRNSVAIPFQKKCLLAISRVRSAIFLREHIGELGFSSSNPRCINVSRENCFASAA
jgi:hypothetical protein